jgi:SAM-dependent methyltransferase
MTDPLAAGRFHADRPTDLHRLPRWHRLAYMMRRLDSTLERLSTELEGTVLDFGCAEMPYRRLFEECIGADLPGNPRAEIEIKPDGTLPLEDESVDSVLSTEVLEHVEDPQTYLSECFRVVRAGGRMLLSTPGIFVWHPDPVDYWRWTSQGLRFEIERAGFEVIHFEGIVGLVAAGLQLVHDGIAYRLPRRVQPAFALLMSGLYALADRVEPRRMKDLNALVFAVVAQKPVRT